MQDLEVAFSLTEGCQRLRAQHRHDHRNNGLLFDWLM